MNSVKHSEKQWMVVTELNKLKCWKIFALTDDEHQSQMKINN